MKNAIMSAVLVIIIAFSMTILYKVIEFGLY